MPIVGRRLLVMNYYKVECFDEYDYYSFKVLANDKCDALYVAQTEMSDHYDIMGYHIEPETAYYDLS